MSVRPLLQIHGLVVERGRTRILDGIDWTVRSGEHWAILGPNGCGKTALLSAVCAYQHPSSGTIELFGERYGRADWRALRKRVGLVSSAIAQQIHGSEQAQVLVAIGADAELRSFERPGASRLRRARRLLAQLGCADIARRPWSVLSLGERQRVLIARALMARPRLLILDEPCMGLDPVARVRFLEQIDGLLADADAPTVIMVSHHVDELPARCEQVLLLRAGRVVAAGQRRRCLRDALLSETFDAPMRCWGRPGRERVELLEEA